MADPHAECIEILVDGFFDSPVMAWIFLDEVTRPAALEAWFRFWIEAYGEKNGITVSTGDGACLWAKPDVPPLSAEETNALVGIVRDYNGDRTGLVLGSLSSVARPTEPHWYCNGIATRRNARGRGVGAGLIEPFLARADAEAIPVFLESSNPRNVSFYRRYGFEDFGPYVDLPGAGELLLPLLRPVGARGL